MYSKSLVQSRQRESTIRQSPDLFRKYYLWSVTGTRYPLQTPFHSWSKRFLTLAACRPLTFLAMSMWGRCSPSVCTSLPMPRRNQFRTLWFSEEESISIPARPRESTNYDFRDKRLYIARCALITLKNYASNSNTMCVTSRSAHL